MRWNEIMPGVYAGSATAKSISQETAIWWQCPACQYIISGLTISLLSVETKCARCRETRLGDFVSISALPR
jgi:bacterioferritin-associated ferredoxin